MQETQELTLPVSGKKVMVRGYVTGLIDQEVRKITLGANKTRYEVDVDPNQTDPSKASEMPDNAKVIVDTDPTVQIAADNKLLELMVLAVDGSNGDVMNQLLALPVQDVQYVIDQVKALQAEAEVSDPKEAS